MEFLIHFTLVTLFVSICYVDCIMFRLNVNSKRCVGNIIHPKTVVSGEYEVSQFQNQIVDLKVYDQNEQAFLTFDGIKQQGKFVFTSSDLDTKYLVCFSSRTSHGMGGAPQDITLIIKHGVEAKSYEGLTNRSHLKPLEVELKRLEDLSQEIIDDFEYMKSREEQMRYINETTSSRVLYFSLFGMLCLVALAVWQVLYMRRYFKAKKLIE